MPTRNSRKTYTADSYYHVYSRGINKEAIFHDDHDYGFFLSLFKRYLSPTQKRNKSGRIYPNHSKVIELNAFCLMPNHIHLLIYQNDTNGLKKLMQSVMTSYSMYYNRKYEHYGPVFQGRYLASKIDHRDYLEHISRYIHLNPKNFRNYEYSSLQYYLGSKHAEWLNVNRVMELFSDQQEYLEFLDDYGDYKNMLDELKYEIAN